MYIHTADIFNWERRYQNIPIYIHYQGEYKILYFENHNRNFIFFKVEVSKSLDHIRLIVLKNSVLYIIQSTLGDSKSRGKKNSTY